ncbi:MAG: hypothetical protein QOK47_1631, partial [Actinomycetota bacterium]|nr:hypothetical protein [Actinomycetota bacterium]
APTTEGEVANPDDGSIDPSTAQEETDTTGRYGWHVVSGCWYVTVSASGFQDAVSSVVGVPEAVTDLDVTLQGDDEGNGHEHSPSPSPSASRTPTSSPSPTSDPSPTPSDEPTEEPPAQCDAANGDVCGTKGDDEVVVDGSDDPDGDGQVTVHVGAGDDDVCIDEDSGLSARVLGGTGNDTFKVGDCASSAARPSVNSLNFLLVAAAQQSTGAFFGGFGRDLMIGGRGSDLMNGGSGVDRMRGAGGNDYLKSAKGKDHLKSGAGTDWVYGGADKDVLEGGPGADKLYGDRGHDTCVGGSGKDDLFGCEVEKTRNF